MCFYFYFLEYTIILVLSMCEALSKLAECIKNSKLLTLK